MKIEQFRIKDFKSIKELVIDDLNAINIFYGLNDAGKSNILQAMGLWLHFLQNSNNQPPFESYINHDYWYRFGTKAFQIEAIFNTDLRVKESLINNLDLKFTDEFHKIFLNFNIQQLRFGAKLTVNPKIKFSLTLGIPSKQMVDAEFSFSDFGISEPLFDMVHAHRRIEKEYWQQNNNSKPQELVSHNNLKQNLFYAYLSRDFQHKQRFEAVKNVLAQEPFQLGQLDVALDPQSNEIDVGFVQQNNRLPIEQFGSGTQQLLLMLGQLFLNNYPLIALEEPEMNLSPTHQGHLINTLQKLMQEPTSGLKQLFISTHSPYLEFTENAYQVFRDEEGWTQVKKVSQKEAENYFALENRGEENGARLNSQNQITLRDNIVQDLNLERGDFVFVLKNEETGRWELHTKEEVLPKLKEAWQD